MTHLSRAGSGCSPLVAPARPLLDAASLLIRLPEPVLPFRFGVGVRPRGDLRPFAQPRPRNPTITMGIRGAVARNRNGAVVWRVRVEHPMFTAARPSPVPGVVALLLSTGLVLALDWRRS